MYGKIPASAIPIVDPKTGIIYKSKAEAIKTLRISVKEFNEKLAKKELEVYENKND